MSAFQMQSIADFDRQQILRRETNQPAIVIEEARSDFRLQLALTSLQYNQQFINFLDSKANSLLLVNSLCLAAGASVPGKWLWLCLLASLTAIGLCLMVFWTRKTSSAPKERGQVFYYKHILRRRGREELVHDMKHVEHQEALDALARQIHDLAQLADNKFSAYRLAQTATVLSVLLWLVLQLPALVK